jgi:hypothetical protein
MLAEVPTHEDQARKWVSTWSEARGAWFDIVAISQDGKACLFGKLVP